MDGHFCVRTNTSCGGQSILDNGAVHAGGLGMGSSWDSWLAYGQWYDLPKRLYLRTCGELQSKLSSSDHLMLSADLNSGVGSQPVKYDG